ncbi:unnamed protein product, partial [Rotaria sp. Silwood1]
VDGVFGGYATNTTELYDPSTGTWITTGNMHNQRYLHTACVLENGKVLVTGGSDVDGYAKNATELYDPSTGTWRTTGSMKYGRYYHTASVLTNGKVLVTGGLNGSDVDAPSLNSAELYDQSTGTWTTTGSMKYGRVYHTTSVLANGKVLVTGGAGAWLGFNSTELYDPSTGTWTATDNMNHARYFRTASVLTNGKVLVAGGYDNTRTSRRKAPIEANERYILREETTIQRILQESQEGRETR